MLIAENVEHETGIYQEIECELIKMLQETFPFWEGMFCLNTS